MFPRQQQGVPFPDIGCPKMNEWFYVEVKRRKNITDRMALQFFYKAIEDWTKWDDDFGGEDSLTKPILVFRGDREEWQVVLWPDAGQHFPNEYELDGPNLVCIPWSDFESWLDKKLNHKEG